MNHCSSLVLGAKLKDIEKTWKIQMSKRCFKNDIKIIDKKWTDLNINIYVCIYLSVYKYISGGEFQARNSSGMVTLSDE